MQFKPSLLLIFLLYTTPVFSQGMDSLFNLLNKTDLEQEKVDLWNEISNQQQPIGGKEAAQNALNLAKQINYKKGQADANYFLGTYYYLKDEPTAAKAHFVAALALYEALDAKPDKTYTLIYLGEAYYFEAEYTIALKHLREAERVALEIKDNSLLAMTFQTLAYIYTDGLKDKEMAEMYLLKSISIFEQENEITQLIDGYNALADFYVENNQVNSSLLFIQKGEDRLALLDSSAYSTYIYNSLTILKGTCYIKAGNIDTAELFIAQSLPFFIENENWYSVAMAYTDLSTIALERGNFKEAIAFAKESNNLDITKSSFLKNTKTIRDAFKDLNQDSFYFYNEKYIVALADTKHANNINDIHKVFKEEALEHKKKVLVEEKTNSNTIYIGILLAGLLIGLSVLFFYKSFKSKQIPFEATKQLKETEIDALKQKVDHFERSLLSKEIDIKRQQSSIDNTTQYLKEIVTKDNPAELKKSIQKLARQLEHNQNNKNQWEFFSQQFEQIHPNFFNKLKRHTSNLSIRELRLCAYSRLDMTNQEVAQILGIATSSVSKARHRLKKKMDLNKEQDLNQFLADL